MNTSLPEDRWEFLKKSQEMRWEALCHAALGKELSHLAENLPARQWLAPTEPLNFACQMATGDSWYNGKFRTVSERTYDFLNLSHF